MKKTILISGGGGKLAQEIKKSAVNFNVIVPSKIEMDIRNISNIEIYLKKYNPDYFIHAAAFTKPMKNHEKFPEISITTNIVGTANVVMACLNFLSTKLIYISTDYVYPGLTGNYKETDGTSPYSKINDGISKYGWSKLGGECAVQMYKNSLILRTCMTERPFVHKSAFANVKTNFIYHDDFIKIFLKILNKKGIFNIGGKPQTLYQFAKNENKAVKKVLSKGELPLKMDMDLKKISKYIK